MRAVVCALLLTACASRPGSRPADAPRATPDPPAEQDVLDKAYALVRAGLGECDRHAETCGLWTRNEDEEAKVDRACARQDRLAELFESDETILHLPDDIAALLAAGADSDLLRRVGWRLDDEDLLRFVAAVAGQSPRRANEIMDLLLERDPPVIVRAVEELRLDEAVGFLDGVENRDTLIAAILDDRFGTVGKRDAIDRLFERGAPELPANLDLTPELVALAGSSDCGLAAAASFALAALGRPELLPASSAADEATFMRSLCLFASYEGGTSTTAMSDALLGVGAAGIEVVYAEGEPFADSTEPVTQTHWFPDGDLVMWLLPELPAAVCDGTVCRDPTGTIELVLTPGADGALHLTRLVRHRDFAAERRCERGEGAF